MNKTWQFFLAALLAPMAVFARQDAGLLLEDAWVRALPPTQPNTAAYLVLSNRGAQAVEVVGASADIADRVEIHTTREVEGYLRMEQLPALQVGPGQSVALEPGGAHLMLLDLARMPAPGDVVRLCLRTAGGGEACTDAEVRKGGAGQHSHHHH